MTPALIGQLIGSIVASLLLVPLFAWIVRRIFRRVSLHLSFVVGAVIASVVGAMAYNFGTHHEFGFHLQAFAMYGFGAIVAAFILVMFSRDDRVPSVFEASQTKQGRLYAKRPTGKGLNGWQRIWLVLTVVALVVFVGIVPISYMPGRDYLAEAEIQADIENPICRAYVVEPISSLVQPTYGEPCDRLYSARKYYGGHSVPYTLKQYQDWHRANWWSNYLGSVLFTLVATLLMSGLVYLLGWSVAWIRRGFQRD